MEEQDHDFSEFENIKQQKRRSLLSWWIWVILLLYNAFTTIDFFGNVYGITTGYVFAFDVVNLERLVAYPYFPIVSVVLWLSMLISFIMLWLEKRTAARIAMWCYGIMLALCTAILIKGLFSGHFYLRFEMIIFIDLILRLSDKRKKWENEAIPRYDDKTNEVSN